MELIESIDELPPGLERALLRILSFRVGKSQAIKKRELLNELRLHGYRIHERLVRDLMSDLRDRGEMICSASGAGGGYYLPGDWDELEEYFGTELHPRAMALLNQEKAMRKTAENRWGVYSKQGRLF